MVKRWEEKTGNEKLRIMGTTRSWVDGGWGGGAVLYVLGFCCFLGLGCLGLGLPFCLGCGLLWVSYQLLGLVLRVFKKKKKSEVRYYCSCMMLPCVSLQGFCFEIFLLMIWKSFFAD